jgi:hypothetical protein
LVLLSPGTKHIESKQVQLCRKGDIYLDEIIGKRSFSVIRLEGIILKILEAGIGTEKYRDYSELLDRSKHTGYSEEDVARIFEE